jgi:hypothetical protein
VGSYPVIFSLTDGTLSVSETVVITVTKTNRKPVLDPIPARTVAEHSPLAYTLSAQDPDNDSLTFACADLPAGATIDPVSGAFAWTPSFSQAGTYKLTFSVSDGTDSAVQVADILVTDVNRPPAITTTSLPASRIGKPYTSAIAAVDPDGDTLTFALASAAGSELPPGLGMDPATGVLKNWTPVIGDIGKSYGFAVTVTDGKGGSDTRTFTIPTITDTIPPVVQLNAPAEVIPGASFTVSALGTDNIAVTSISFVVNTTLNVNSGTISCVSADNCQFQITTNQNMAPGSSIVIDAEARDAADNVGKGSVTVKIALAPDTEAPTVSLAAPL